MKTEFRVGDRVRVYLVDAVGNDNDRTGEIVTISQSQNSVYVKTEIGDGWYHLKQLRRLKPKPKAPRGKIGGMVVWIDPVDIDRRFNDRNYIPIGLSKIEPTDIKFIEAEDQT